MTSDQMQGGTTAAPVLRILQTTDLHGAVRAFDYTTDRATNGGSLSRLASLIEQARGGCDASLLFDNGDFLFGNALVDHWAETGATRAHPMIAAMNLLGYDAVALGNHELNFGMGVLTAALSAAQFPVLCANLHEQGQPILPPTRIITHQMRDAQGIPRDLRIGVVAVLPPQVMQWDASHLGTGFSVKGMAETVRHHVPRLRADGADLVIVLNHSGLSAVPETVDQENAGLSIATIAGVDAVLCGHQHGLFPGPQFAALFGACTKSGRLHGVPIVMAGFGGSHLGVIDLSLAWSAQSGWRVTDSHVGLRATTSHHAREMHSLAPESPDILRVSQADHDTTRRHMSQPVGATETALHSYFAHVAPSPVSRLVAAAQAWHARRLLSGRPESERPLLSAATVFRCGGIGGPAHYVDIPAGALHRRDLHALYDFPNALALVELPGHALRDWLDQSSGLFSRVIPGTTGQPLTQAAFPTYDFDTLWGLSCQIDLSQPPRISDAGQALDGPGRIMDLRWNGRALDPNQRFIVATNSYRADGGGHFAALRAARRIDIGSAPRVRDVLAEYLAAAAPAPDWPQPWRFVPMPGTSAQIVTGPGAFAHAEDIARLGLIPAGDDATGFVRFDLPL